MPEISMSALEAKLAGLRSELDTATKFNDINLIRSYVAETVLAYIVSGIKVDYDAIEKTLLKEFGGHSQREQRVRSAVASLRARTLEPLSPQLDE